MIKQLRSGFPKRSDVQLVNNECFFANTTVIADGHIWGVNLFV